MNASLVPAALPVLTREGCASGPHLMPMAWRRSVRSVSAGVLLEHLTQSRPEGGRGSCEPTATSKIGLSVPPAPHPSRTHHGLGVRSKRSRSVATAIARPAMLDSSTSEARIDTDAAASRSSE